MSILYPRTVSVRRQKASGAVGGKVGYGGDNPNTEAVIASGLSASIQYKRVGVANPTNLPADSRRPQWVIVIPQAGNTTNISLGLIAENDVVQDEIGRRYQVYAADWQVTGYQLLVELLNS